MVSRNLSFSAENQRILHETKSALANQLHTKKTICVNLRENNPNHVYMPLALLAIYTPARIRALPRYAIVVIGSLRNRALTTTVVMGLRYT